MFLLVFIKKLAFIMINASYLFPLACFYEEPFDLFLLNIPNYFSISCSVTNDYAMLTDEQKLNYLKFPDFYIYNSGFQYTSGFMYDFKLHDYSDNMDLILTKSQVKKIFYYDSGEYFGSSPDFKTFINNLINISDVFNNKIDNLIAFFKEYKYIISLSVNASRASSYNQVFSVVNNAVLLDVDIYKEPIDNTNVFQILNGISQVWSTQLSEDDIYKINSIEQYNRNFILFHQKDFNTSSNEISSGSSSSVDLSTINTQITNIANALKVTETINNEDVEKNITQTLKEKDLLVVNNLDISDKLSFKPKSNGYPDDEGVF